jgi:hypothetical protein
MGSKKPLKTGLASFKTPSLQPLGLNNNNWTKASDKDVRDTAIFFSITPKNFRFFYSSGVDLHLLVNVE